MRLRFILSAAVLACIIGGFLSVAVNGASYGLQYNLVYTPANPGSSTILINKFTNSGTVAEQVTGITITSDLGTFTASSGLPLQVPVGQTVELNMTEQIPSSASVSSHSVTASIVFQYQDPTSMQWATPNTSPLAVQGSINVTSNAGLGLITVTAIGALVGAVVAVSIALIVRRRKAKPSPLGYPAPSAPPPGPTPTQTN